ncbi:3-methylcrotonoyl-CoA carboxylase alpha subunit /biotin carboxylase /acetyl-CoA carboxylase carboxyltransferase subunit alpha [Luteibacter rhizovicinus]|uniref:Biotin carboxylase n=1 Tax=Luteibacter rhizovicinus TaxID=242606 RepID=A0A4R3Z0G3_9GAMM|nr:acetyl/propionyl/methylcrotonyl-CoA carboxylase subunit alpha [Luteibacter rhizovicinus]TCV97183.1 3-methylcrotonoyl-CoA carboxylase alpha subunit /biotin carboxylase /acetyl-CoA carboxylase carboxyltransferase subunit alpha [Luteibacter rhizovicinus]
MFDCILIANRGEIACRVIRTCRRLGIRTVAVYSTADADAQHVRLADEAWPIGGPRPAESYLRADAIIEVAKRAGAQAIHPGYGFLSENTAFARACAEAGIVFIGPRPESIDAMGSKAAAKALMETHDVPLVPGYHGADQDPVRLADEAARTGFPLMIKAASGGGGKGMRIVRTAGDFAEALASAQREAANAFGDTRVILERYVEHPRHIEFQVFGDTQGNVIHLNERECSAQRRYQKVLEETPSPFLDAERRTRMGAAAVAAAKAVNYVGAGTVEFIVAQDGEFFFMEMNTRLQVEHPVTEETLGLDLVEWQLRIASGEPLPLAQDDVRAHGHAIEVRLYAEDPEQNFLPGSGKLRRLTLPQPSAHVRLDGGVVEGDTVTIFYDPMIAKLIVHDATREAALERLSEALAASDIVGPKSNIAFLERLVRHPAIVGGSIDTGYLDRHLDQFLTGTTTACSDTVFAAATAALLTEEARQKAPDGDPGSPWAVADAWRLGHPGKRVVALMEGNVRHEIDAHGHDGHYVLRHADAACTVSGARLSGDTLSARFDEHARRVPLSIGHGRIRVHDTNAQRWIFEQAPAFAWISTEAQGAKHVTAPMPGRIVLVKTAVGDAVEEGQELMVMEAMKMELALKAPRAGTIQSIMAAQGDFVDADSVLVRFVDAT